MSEHREDVSDSFERGVSCAAKLLKWFAGGALLLASALTATSAWAYHGGPETVEVLGWDPAERKIFCAIHDHSEAVYPDGLVYFSLDSLNQTLATRVPWSRQAGVPEADRKRRWDAILRRLRPLELVEGPAIPRGGHVVSRDSVKAEGQLVARYRVRVGSGDAGVGSLEVLTYYDSSVYIHRVYKVPGRDEVLVVLAYVGQIYGAEEVQVPVLQRGPTTPAIYVEWKQWDP